MTAGTPHGRVGTRRARSLTSAGPLTYITLTVAVVLSAFPLYWTFIVASHTNEVVSRVPPAVAPGGRFAENAERAITHETANIGAALINTAIVSSVVTFSVVFFSSLAGFAFAKLRFRGSNVLLLCVIATLAVPVQVLGVIPLYMLMTNIGWHNSLQAVIVPFLVNAFGVFFMRQFIVGGVPTELIECSRVDGCSTIRIYWHVVLPAIRPAAAVLGLLVFMQTWNEFLWPLIVLTPENPVVQVSLNTLKAGYFQDNTLVMAGTALATLPLLLVFGLLCRQIIGGIMEGGVKG